MTPSSVKSAILSEDHVSFTRVKGVGPKTAKRLIVELKDKIEKISVGQEFGIPTSQSNTSRQEALSALITLGFQKAQVLKAITKAAQTLDDDVETEEWIKTALQHLAG